MATPVIKGFGDRRKLQPVAGREARPCPADDRASAVISAVVLCAAIVFGIALSGCASVPQQPMEVPDDPVFRLASYEFDPASRLIDRVGPIPAHVKRYLEEGDGRSYSNYTPTPDELDMIEEYLALLPPRQQRVLQDRLVGIYFLDPFLGGGLTEFTLAENDEIHTFMVFNALTLHRSLSEWITYRENTVFGSADGQRLRADCGTRYTGFLHVLLHEATHVVDYVEGTASYMQSFVPASDGPREAPDPDNPFAVGVWAGMFRPTRRSDYDLRERVTYYGMSDGPHLSIAEAEKAYEQLSDSPFVSFYASTAVWEDLAELVTWHHLTNVLGVSQRIILSWPDRQDRVFDFHPDPVTEARRDVIESFYR